MDVDGKFGSYLVATGRVPETVVQKARSYQAQMPFMRIGEILVNLQAIGFTDLLESLRGYRAQCKLGQLLIMEGIITKPQLENALQRQSAAGGLMGEILVTLGYCTAEQVQEALSVQKKQANA
ncbi:MAG TPA: hypothetical protein V6D05_16905 [Stenomitos sp.]